MGNVERVRRAQSDRKLHNEGLQMSKSVEQVPWLVSSLTYSFLAILFKQLTKRMYSHYAHGDSVNIFLK